MRFKKRKKEKELSSICRANKFLFAWIFISMRRFVLTYQGIRMSDCDLFILIYCVVNVSG